MKVSSILTTPLNFCSNAAEMVTQEQISIASAMVNLTLWVSSSLNMARYLDYLHLLLGKIAVYGKLMKRLGYSLLHTSLFIGNIGIKVVLFITIQVTSAWLMIPLSGMTVHKLIHADHILEIHINHPKE